MSRPIIVALHGVGSTEAQMRTALSPLEPLAEVIALSGPQPFDGGGAARQWFSVSGVTEENRADRTAAALAELLPRLEQLASARGVSRHQLILLGFSQGAILTLAAVAAGAHLGPAIAVAGRLATPAVTIGPDEAATVLLVHDQHDRVMPSALSSAAADRLAKAGHRVRTSFSTGVGHSIGPATLEAISEWLSWLALSAPRDVPHKSGVAKRAKPGLQSNQEQTGAKNEKA